MIKKNTFLVVLFLLISSSVFANNVELQVLSSVVKNQKIDGAHIFLQRNGEQSSESKSDINGSAKINSNFSDDNETLLIIKKNGYSNLVAKCPCRNMVYALSPIMDHPDGVRFILTWNKAPADLDAHVAYPGNHIYFDRRNGGRINFDVDDTDGFGPETITISQKKSGDNYVYAVHAFTSSSEGKSVSLSQSGATVMVYVGQTLVRIFRIPKDKPGNLWTVFRINHQGEFQDINTLETIKLVDGSSFKAIAKTLVSYHQSGSDVIPLIDPININRSRELNERATALYKKGALIESMELYQQAVDLNPEDPQLYSNLGLVYLRGNRFSEAIWANRKAVALASGATASIVKASSYYNMAQAYEKLDHLKQALEYYELAKQQKNNPTYDFAITRINGRLANIQKTPSLDVEKVFSGLGHYHGPANGFDILLNEITDVPLDSVDTDNPGDVILHFAASKGIHIEGIIREEFNNFISSHNQYALADKKRWKINIYASGFETPNLKETTELTATRLTPYVHLKLCIVDSEGNISEIGSNNPLVDIPAFIDFASMKADPSRLDHVWRVASRQAIEELFVKYQKFLGQ